ncbi:hypothetical protein B0O99DRAFT_503851 [Bisporella sp. PMI_857]|nr:hypothetical protein B0O99DRAFT_503851 [Bisporella sp. PMI_857]
MPHKHTRKGEDKSTLDLPPSVLAKPLSTSKSAASNGIFTTEIDAKRSNKKRKRNKDAADDTPKAFQRLMAWKSGAKLPKALDDGIRPSKKQKKAAKGKEEGGQAEPPIQENVIPTIRPGEKMSEFSARVDQALPLSNLINKTQKNGKDPLGLKVGRTKKEKKMHKMYDEWREQDKRIKEKRQEALELAEEEAMDEDGQVKWKADIEPTSRNGKTKGKGKKKKKILGEVDDGDDDPWAQIKKNRAEAKIRLNDVAQAPPTFSSVPREKFKERNKVIIGDVPKASGSLRRREELVEVRKGVLESYRAMNNAKLAAE